jgi:hypothetical protein
MYHSNKNRVKTKLGQTKGNNLHPKSVQTHIKQPKKYFKPFWIRHYKIT